MDQPVSVRSRSSAAFRIDAESSSSIRRSVCHLSLSASSTSPDSCEVTGALRWPNSMRLIRKRSDGAARRGDAPVAGAAGVEEEETSAVGVAASLAMRGTLLIERCDASSTGLRWKMGVLTARHIERTDRAPLAAPAGSGTPVTPARRPQAMTRHHAFFGR